jgi:hypothetical protein
MVVRRFYATVLIIDPPIERKLRQLHHLTPEQVCEVVLFNGHSEARWDVDEENGERWIVRGKTYDGTEIIAYVLPTVADESVYILKTAIRRP